MTFFKLIFLAAVLLFIHHVRAVHASDYVPYQAFYHSWHSGGFIDLIASIHQSGIPKHTKYHHASTKSNLQDPGFRHVVINEIMADPSPTIALPEAEFIELLNTSSQIIDLAGWTISDPKSSATLPTIDIEPGQFIVLCKKGEESLFLPFGKAIGLANWPTLNNSGDQLTLKSADSTIIDQVLYTTNFYKDALKSEGGWSLEQVNPFNFCPDDKNWEASINPEGGTPGKENSINDPSPDLRGPELSNVLAKNAHQIIISFNERIKTSTLMPRHISMTSQNHIDRIDDAQTYTQNAYLWLKNGLQPNILQTLKVKNVTDCAGNLVQEKKSSFQFALAVPADSMDIVINEVLFNPRSGGKDFIEIYNSSENYINLKGWKISNVQSIATNPKIAEISDDLILAPRQYLVVTEDIAILKGDYPFGKGENYYAVKNMPSFPDDSGNFTISDSLDKIIDSFDYLEDYHLNLIKDLNGVSLERISAINASNSKDNWHSAAGTVGYATPGYENSQRIPASTVNDQILIEPKVFHPNNDGINDFTGIHYLFDKSSYLLSIFVYDIEGRKIKEIANNSLSGTSGFYQWNGTNGAKSLVSPGYYIILVDVLDPAGNSFQIKKTVVVAPGF